MLDSYLLAFLVPSFLADVFCGSLVPVRWFPSWWSSNVGTDRAKAVDLYGDVLRRSVWSLSLRCRRRRWRPEPPSSRRSASGKRASQPTICSASLTLSHDAQVLPLAAVANVWRAVLNSQRSFW